MVIFSSLLFHQYVHNASGTILSWYASMLVKHQCARDPCGVVQCISRVPSASIEHAPIQYISRFFISNMFLFPFFTSSSRYVRETETIFVSITTTHGFGCDTGLMREMGNLRQERVSSFFLPSPSFSFILLSSYFFSFFTTFF